MLLGAEREAAEREMKDALLFEIQLAHASQPKELRRNATRMYNPMAVKDLGSLAPMVPWLEYINNILTPDLLQVHDNLLPAPVPKVGFWSQWMVELGSGY